METHTLSAPIAHVFNPSEWLKNFESVGGGHVLTDSAVHIGIAIHGRPAMDQARARHMIDTLTEEERASVLALLRNREARP